MKKSYILSSIACMLLAVSYVNAQSLQTFQAENATYVQSNGITSRASANGTGSGNNVVGRFTVDSHFSKILSVDGGTTAGSTFPLTIRYSNGSLTNAIGSISLYTYVSGSAKFRFQVKFPPTGDYDTFSNITISVLLPASGPTTNNAIKLQRTNDVNAVDVGNVDIDQYIVDSRSTITPVTGVSLSPSAVTLSSFNATTTLSPTFTPSNASITPVNGYANAIYWSSSNPSVATVSNTGVVTSVSNGTAIITALTSDGNYTATSTITVSGPAVYEAENGSLNGSVASNKIISLANASNGKVVSDFSNWNALSQVTSVTGGTGGTGALTIRYSNKNATNGVLTLHLNGAVLYDISFPPTGSETTFADLTTSLNLVSGLNNTVKLQNTNYTGTDGAGSAGGVAIDKYTVTPNTLPTPTITWSQDLSGLLVGGSTVPLTASTNAVGPNVASLSYASDNTGVVSVSGSTLTIAGAGSATVTASQASNTYFNAATLPKTATVTHPVITISGTQTSTALTNPNADINVTSTGDVTIDATRSVYNMSIDGGGKVTLNSGVTLTVNNLILNSDGTGTGTFVDNNSSAGNLIVNGTTTVQQYLTTGRNWYISSPVSGATAAVFNPAGGSNKLYWYDETKGNTTPWTTISSNTTGLTRTQGYVANMAADGVVSFTGGTLNTGSLPTTTINRSDIPTKAGFNLVGNPYPSYLDWDQVSATSTHLLTTIWQRTKTTNNATYQFDTYNSAGKMYISNSGRTVNSHIPPMQAFWVRVDNGYSSGTLNFTNAMRSHKGSQNTGSVQTPNIVNDPIFKSKAINAVSQSVLRLQVSNGTNTDETVVYSNPDALNSYDNFDSPKMFNNSVGIAEIYTVAGNEQLAINGLNAIPYNTEIPLGFSTLTSGNYSLTASQISNFELGTQVILKDYLDVNNPIITDLSDGSSYSFNSAASSNNTSRFSLIFKAPSATTGINPTNTNEVWISTDNNGQVQINGIPAGETNVIIYNSVGQKILSKNLTRNNTQLGTKFEVGIYMVVVTNAGKTYIKKVIID